MRTYTVGFIFIRCHLQKRVVLSDGAEAIPLGRTGFRGEIHDIRSLLSAAGFDFTRPNAEATLKNFHDTGHCTLYRRTSIEAASFIEAIERCEPDAAAAAGSLAVISANPALPFCAYASNPKDSGVKFFIPSDRKIFHATNVAGYLDALPAIENRARQDSKFAVLLRLYQASLREREIDHQILFQLILLEEASDQERGPFAERLRIFAQKHSLEGDLNLVAKECGLSLPMGKDMIDVLIKLRNSATHNGRIDEVSLKEFNGEWVVPLLHNKSALHKAINEAIRYMFCALVGHTRDKMATLITGPFEMRFD